ncbi:MAG: hypothetical protein ACON39_06185 [Coraliomargaritaceae bacterium]
MSAFDGLGVESIARGFAVFAVCSGGHLVFYQKKAATEENA